MMSYSSLRTEMLQMLSYYETEKNVEETEKDIQRFFEKNHSVIRQISNRYFLYRGFSRALEREEKPEESYMQICGEILMIFFLSFLEFVEKGTVRQENWEKSICFAYRLVVHGEKTEENFHEAFCTFFSDISLWEEVLFFPVAV